MIPARY